MIQTRSRAQGVNVEDALREINNTLQMAQRNREEREMREQKKAEIQLGIRVRAVDIDASEEEATAEGARNRNKRPEIIFAGRRCSLPLGPVEREAYDVSSDSNPDNLLEEMEGELQQHSLSNHEDAPKPELSEESVAQEATPMEDDEITMEESKDADTKEETDDPMVVAQEERMNDEEHFQKEMKRKGK